MHIDKFKGKLGFTLPLTMVLLIAFGYMIINLYNMIKAERMESFRRFKEIQTSLTIESAIDYVFFRMESASSKLFRTKNLWHESFDGSISFGLSHIQDGAFSRLNVWNFDSTTTFSVRTGFRKVDLPSLVLLAPQADMALAFDSKIEGGIAVKRGSISYSNHYKFPAGKNSFFDTLYVGDSLSCFDTLEIKPEFSRDQFDTIFKDESCIFDGIDEVQNSIACKMVVMQGDSRCTRCKISADRVFIRGRAKLEQADVRTRFLTLTDSACIGGFFFARDTLNVSLALKQDAPLYLMLQGRRTGVIDYVGSMRIERLIATDVLIAFFGDNWDETTKDIPVSISDKVNLQGTLFSLGTVDFRGNLKGQMTVWNFGFIDGVLWRGYLKGGKIQGDSTVRTLLPDLIYRGGEAGYVR